MSERYNNYINRRIDEENVDLSQHANDIEYRRGLKKLNFRYEFPTGEILEATENDGEASFKIIKDGIILLDFKDLISDYKFVTPRYWLNLSEYDANAPFEFLMNPEKHRNEVQGRWARTGNLISIGTVRSLKDVLSLLHEIGHVTASSDIFEILRAQDEKDKEKLVELASQSERDAWSEALRIARKIKKDVGVNVLEGFSDLEDVKNYIYSALSTHRYRAETQLSGIPTDVLKKIIFDIFGIEPKSKNLEWLDTLFDKRKLIKSNES